MGLSSNTFRDKGRFPEADTPLRLLAVVSESEDNLGAYVIRMECPNCGKAESFVILREEAGQPDVYDLCLHCGASVGIVFQLSVSILKGGSDG